MSEARFSNQNNTAPVISAMKNKDLPINRSFFDITCPISFDASIGAIIPFDVVETLPNSDYEIAYDILTITRNPLLRRLLSGMTVYIHTYACTYDDLWEGAPTFTTRGRSGKVTRTVPVTPTAYATSDDTPVNVSAHFHSPSAYLGVRPRSATTAPYVTSDSSLAYVETNELKPDLINALPLAFYKQICVYNYFPSNLLQSNEHLYPEDEHHFRLSSSCTGTIYSMDYDDDVAALAPTSDQLADVAYSDNDTPLILDKLEVRQFQGDRFNTGLPFPELVRGDIPSIDLVHSQLTIPSMYVTPSNNPKVYVRPELNSDFQHISPLQSGWANNVELYNAGVSTYDAPADFLKTQELELDLPIKTSVTLSQLNALQVLTVFRQRMALSDGSYNELIKAQFNRSPDLHIGKPFYIGGTKQPILFNEVVQQSESSANSPLGRTASRGVSAGSGYIGKYHSKDFGYIMSVLTVVPDTYYTQGLDKLWTRINQDQLYFPLMENLAPEAILNKELFVSGVDNTDNDVFAYQERFSEYKSRRPRVAGALMDTSSAEDSAYTMKRHFESTPSLSYGFTGMFPSNVDMSVFSNQIDYPFIFSIQSKIRCTLPMSYVTMPNDGLTKIS